MDTNRIFVIGDLILDEYIEGNEYRISDEAPVPIVKVDGSEPRLGGAANVANNLNNLGKDVWLCGAVGVSAKDHSAKRFMSEMQRQKLASSYIVVGERMTTTTKSRVIIKGQQVVRFDHEEHVLPNDVMEKLYSKICHLDSNEIDLIVVSDYNKGVITDAVMGLLKEKNVKIIVDPKSPDMNLYKGVFCLTPNLKEFNQMINPNHDVYTKNNLSGIEKAANLMRIEINVDLLIVTLGELGALCCSLAGCKIIPACKVEVTNTIGAGDTFVSALACGLAEQKDIEEAVGMANIAAGIVVSKEYTGVCCREEIERIWRK